MGAIRGLIGSGPRAATLRAARGGLPCLMAAFTALSLGAAEPAAKAPGLNFDRDIRPILSENCYACHGPDEQARKARLRLDLHDEALKPAKSGGRAIVPGDPDASELVQRVFSDDEDEVMPQPKSGKKLTRAQKETLKAWIAQGAVWTRHWAFEPPRRPALPATRNKGWAKNAIDSFVLARLEKENLAPSPEAEKAALLRRVTLDLTGLPPTLAEADAFLADPAPDAYEKVVGRLLASPRYGEHFAHYWLDGARYADSHGFHIDSERGLWKYRDWVIEAFNQNMPFDAFTLDQLAGDLLPNATIEQKIGSGYLRCNMTSGEGGAIDEEYKAKYTFDRVETTSTVWLGLTMTCCRCHNHKYDPILQKEYYGLYAFFNRLDESVMDGNQPHPDPYLSLPTSAQTSRLEELRKRMDEDQAKIDGPKPEVDAKQEAWAARMRERLTAGWTTLQPSKLTATNSTKLTVGEGGGITFNGSWTNEETIEAVAALEPGRFTALRLAFSAPPKSEGDASSRETGRFNLTSAQAEIVARAAGGEAGEPKKLSFQRVYADADAGDASKLTEEGDKASWQAAPGSEARERSVLLALDEPIRVEKGSEIRVRLRFRPSKPGFQAGVLRVSVARGDGLAAALAPPPSVWRLIGPFKVDDLAAGLAAEYPPEREIRFDQGYPGVRGEVKWREKPDFTDGASHQVVDGLQGAHGVHYLYRVLREPSARRLEVALRIDDVGKVWLNGRLVFEQDRKLGPEQGSVKFTLALREGTNTILVKQITFQGDSDFAFDQFRSDPDRLPREVAAVLCLRASPTDDDQHRLRSFYRRETSIEYVRTVEEIAAMRRERQVVERSIATTMIGKDAASPRDTFILLRGEYDKKGDKVPPVVPSILQPWPAGGPTNRLGLARWILDPSNPLTARVTVNRFWQQYFGVGLVKTTEDFGAQGERPSHPELLDWLAVEFRESGWDVKHLQRLIVTSAAYRQSSKETPALIAADPENRSLARGPRFRMDAEVVRDSALFMSGLLVEKFGGRAVKPWQPPGLWEAVSYNNSQKYVVDNGEGRHRRSLYTYWKRQSPPPNMLIFDAATRESCVVRRPRTNTPLQALVMLNDPQFVEAARALARRILAEAPPNPRQRVIYGFRLATGRAPRADEIKVLLGVYTGQRADFRKNRGEARKFLETDGLRDTGKMDEAEWAAWATVAGVLMNLDETLTKG